MGDLGRGCNFDPAKKITKIETIIKKDEHMFTQINFYHHQQRLVQVGDKSDSDVEK